MSAQIRMIMEIKGIVLFQQGNGEERKVGLDFSDYELEGPYPQILKFLGANPQQFGPDGQDNALKEGIQYSVESSSGDELIIISADGTQLRWISIEA